MAALDVTSEVQDFSNSTPNIDHRVHYAEDPEPSKHSPIARSFHSTDELPTRGHRVPILKRRGTRANTFNSIKTFRAVNAYKIRPQWEPGQEPGLDPNKENGGRPEKPELHDECEVTVVDYSEDDMEMRHLDNKSLLTWLDKEQVKKGGRDRWVKCRWVNVNGMSWDVISALGKWKKLHRLAIEDLVNTRTRTKADWYSDHTYIVLTLQKLVHLHADGSDQHDGDSDTGSSISDHKKRKGLKKMLGDLFGFGESRIPGTEESGELHDPAFKYVSAHTDGLAGAPVQKLRTLQRYHEGPNQERAAFMEAHSALTPKNLAVCAEQVSIFLCEDNTVISFFQSSAEDIEHPIISRLSTEDTILRRSCDASMLTQALVDAIIDLAIPVTTAYQDVIGELELDILTEPDIKHTTQLYIVTSEITMMRNIMSPITSLVNALRDHKSNPISKDIIPSQDSPPIAGVKISPLTITYLGDVEDHSIIILNTLDQMTTSASHLIDLIFNTISAYQNESMKQLTIVTIFFLPMTFITGYFGMNIDNFGSLSYGESGFWAITAPVVVVVMIFLMWGKIWRWFRQYVLRRGIKRRKETRLERERRERKKGL